MALLPIAAKVAFLSQLCASFLISLALHVLRTIEFATYKMFPGETVALLFYMALFDMDKEGHCMFYTGSFVSGAPHINILRFKKTVSEKASETFDKTNCGVEKREGDPGGSPGV